jgi:hypothetical protein
LNILDTLSFFSDKKEVNTSKEEWRRKIKEIMATTSETVAVKTPSEKADKFSAMIDNLPDPINTCGWSNFKRLIDEGYIDSEGDLYYLNDTAITHFGRIFNQIRLDPSGKPKVNLERLYTVLSGNFFPQGEAEWLVDAYFDMLFRARCPPGSRLGLLTLAPPKKLFLKDLKLRAKETYGQWNANVQVDRYSSGDVGGATRTERSDFFTACVYAMCAKPIQGFTLYDSSENPVLRAERKVFFPLSYLKSDTSKITALPTYAVYTKVDILHSYLDSVMEIATNTGRGQTAEKITEIMGNNMMDAHLFEDRHRPLTYRQASALHGKAPIHGSINPHAYHRQSALFMELTGSLRDVTNADTTFAGKDIVSMSNAFKSINARPDLLVSTLVGLRDIMLLCSDIELGNYSVVFHLWRGLWEFTNKQNTVTMRSSHYHSDGYAYYEFNNPAFFMLFKDTPYGVSEMEDSRPIDLIEDFDAACHSGFSVDHRGKLTVTKETMNKAVEMARNELNQSQIPPSNLKVRKMESLIHNLEEGSSDEEHLRRID